MIFFCLCWAFGFFVFLFFSVLFCCDLICSLLCFALFLFVFALFGIVLYSFLCVFYFYSSIYLFNYFAYKKLCLKIWCFARKLCTLISLLHRAMAYLRVQSDMRCLLYLSKHQDRNSIQLWVFIVYLSWIFISMFMVLGSKTHLRKSR